MEFTPRYKNLVELLYSSVKQFADQPLFASRKNGTWQWITYKAFGETVDQCRAGLAHLGIRPGDRVAVISDNRLEWAVGAYATYTLGAVYVPMYQAQIEGEWKHILRDSGARVCFVADDAIETHVKRLQADLMGLEKIINFEAKTDDESSYVGLLKRGSQHPREAWTPSEEAVATFVYTASVRGDPRGVMLTHLNLASNSCAIAQGNSGAVRDGDRSLAFLPWAHVFGGCIELNALIACGGSMAICDDPHKVFEYLPEVQATVLFSVPRIWEGICSDIRSQINSGSVFTRAVFNAGLLARSKQRQGRDLTWRERIALSLVRKFVFPSIRQRFGGRLRCANSGAAALSQEYRDILQDLGVPIYESYGLTESGGCATGSGPTVNRSGSVGKPIADTRITLDKEVAGAQDDEGEIIIHGPGVMPGYYNLPDDTRAAFTEDGGLRTGDLGRIDQDGFLYITGNIKELYKLANGRYVAPVVLEEKLRRSTFIAQCLIYGANKPHNVALIVPDLASLMAWGRREGLSPFVDTLLKNPKTRKLLEEEIEQSSREFKGFERIRGFALLNREFTVADGTLTPALELNRRNIIAKYRDQLNALYR